MTNRVSLPLEGEPVLPVLSEAEGRVGVGVFYTRLTSGRY